MSEIATQIGHDEIVYTGNIIEVIHRQMQVGEKIKTFEIAKRSPGTRLIIVDSDNKKILLTKEHRYEVGESDYRLPGGKVCDTLEEYRRIRELGTIESTAANQAKVEALQEAGVTVEKIDLFQVAKSGGPTVEWDLFYFVVTKFSLSEQDLEMGEDITAEWLSYQDAIGLVLSGAMKEDRSVGVLMKYFRSIGQI